MAHTWHAEIWHSDKTNKLTFADGDDIIVTQGIGLAEIPQCFLERNMPFKLVLSINNNWAVPARNVLSPLFALWSNGAVGALKRGMYVRAYYTDSITGTEYRAFQGRIKSIAEGSNGTIVLTAYNELMILGEFKDQFVVFANARDRIGDAALANGPDISIAFNADDQIAATLPDTDIVAPLMKLMLAEPFADTALPVFGTQSGVALAQNAQFTTLIARSANFYKVRIKYCVGGGADIPNCRLKVYTADANNRPGTLLATSEAFTLPQTGVAVWSQFETLPAPVKLTPGTKYCFVIDQLATGGGAAIMVTQNSNDGKDWESVINCGYWNGSSWVSTFAPPTFCADIMPIYLEEREIDSVDYRLTPGVSSTAIVIDYGTTNITDANVTEWGKFLRVSYYYGKVLVPDIMIALAQRAGLSASLATGASSALGLGYYNTSTYSYLDCLRELADLWDNDTGGGRQLTFQAYMGGNLDDKIMRIGLRYRPWNESILTSTFTDDPLIAETTMALKRIASGGSLSRTFEAKIGTQRMIGKAADGSPISMEIDDRLWGADSLVDATGSPLMEVAMDDTITSGEQLTSATESIIREQHQNAVEGQLPLNGCFISYWDLSPSSAFFGQCAPFKITRPRYALSDHMAVARRISIQGRQTIMELDNERLPDVSMVRRSMEKALQAQSFNVSSLPDTVYIFARYASQLTGYSGYDRVRIGRSDGAYWDTYQSAKTKIKVTNDHCAPNGVGYVHFAGFFPGGRPTSVSSYVYSGGAPHVYAITKVAIGDGTTWIEVTLDRAHYVWAHQNVLIDFRAPR